MTTLRAVLIIAFSVVYCLAELLLARREHRRKIPVQQTVWRSAALLGLFAATMSVMAGLRVWLAVGLGLLVGGLFPLQVMGLVNREKAVREGRGRPRK